ncbi:MAG: hypothetical protein ACFE0O_05185 [Opitutales bacterium]
MVAFGTFLVIIALSLVVTRVASIALMQTGLSKDLARFQARSAFSGAGFTTNEAERVVSHPARRKVIGLLILLGNAGLVSAVATLLLGVLQTQSTDHYLRNFVFLLAGVVLIVLLAFSKRVDAVISPPIGRLLDRVSEIRIRD